MMQFISIEFLIAFLFIIDLFLIFLLILFVRRVNRIPRNLPGPLQEEQDPEEIQAQAEARAREEAGLAAKSVADMLEPLLESSKNTALEFDHLIREKKKLTRNLNHALDSKMISINLLLSRATALNKKLEDQLYEVRRSLPQSQVPLPIPQEPNVLDQQRQIIDLYYKEVDIDTIAERLSIPKGEVQLVIDLKEKFIAMEQTP